MRTQEQMLNDFAEMWPLCYEYDPLDGTVGCRQCKAWHSPHWVLYPHNKGCVVGRFEADLRESDEKRQAEQAEKE